MLLPFRALYGSRHIDVDARRSDPSAGDGAVRPLPIRRSHSPRGSTTRQCADVRAGERHGGGPKRSRHPGLIAEDPATRATTRRD